MGLVREVLPQDMCLTEDAPELIVIVDGVGISSMFIFAIGALQLRLELARGTTD